MAMMVAMMVVRRAKVSAVHVANVDGGMTDVNPLTTAVRAQVPVYQSWRVASRPGNRPHQANGSGTLNMGSLTTSAF
jgi:hypothetical protein